MHPQSRHLLALMQVKEGSSACMREGSGEPGLALSVSLVELEYLSINLRSPMPVAGSARTVRKGSVHFKEILPTSLGTARTMPDRTCKVRRHGPGHEDMQTVTPSIVAAKLTSASSPE